MIAILSSVGSEMESVMSSIQENWFGNFLLNICAYGVIILPAALFIRYFKNSQSLQQRNVKYINTCIYIYYIYMCMCVQLIYVCMYFEY